MIKLKNVSKFYYSKGVIATGFTKVNLELKIGEFVAIARVFAKDTPIIIADEPTDILDIKIF